MDRILIPAYKYCFAITGILFQDFRPNTALDGMPEGMVVLLGHKLVVSVFVGALGGPTVEEQRAQTLCLVVIFLTLAIYIAVAKPFVLKRANICEAFVAFIQFYAYL